jgi:cytochrome P450
MIHGIQLDQAEFFTGDPFPVYRWMRQHVPVFWYEKGGWWALTRYEDVRHVSTHPELFSSSRGIMMPNVAGVTPDQLDLMIFNDPPRHRSLRSLVKRGFTPHRVARMEPRLRQIAREVAAQLAPGSSLDFAQAIAAPLPTLVIAELLGAPATDWEDFRRWSDAVIAVADPDEELDIAEAQTALHAYFMDLIEQRRRRPQDDVISELLAASAEHPEVTTQDIYNLCWLLLVAGNETTRNLIALGSRALLEHPDQLQLLLDDARRIPLAVEEMLRWCNPVTHMMRVALTDVELRGTRIRRGQWLAMLYGAANRDEEVFGPDAEQFRVLRQPNRHVQFGFGEHICIGAHLARLEARIMFEELLPHLPQLEVTGPIHRVRSTMVPSVKHMPVEVRA